MRTYYVFRYKYLVPQFKNNLFCFTLFSFFLSRNQTERVYAIPDALVRPKFVWRPQATHMYSSGRHLGSTFLFYSTSQLLLREENNTFSSLIDP